MLLTENQNIYVVRIQKKPFAYEIVAVMVFSVPLYDCGGCA